MPETMPQNTEEAAYTAFALIDELIKLLVDHGILGAPAIKEMLVTVAKRLMEENNFASNRAAHFVADRMAGKE